MVFREVTYLVVLVRIMTAIVIGGLIGQERSMKHRPAGLRTYMVVCVGSCLIMLTNQYIYQATGTGDPMRLGAQVISGIGFLGAGTIIVTKHNQIKGLTTAAGLWASAGVGLALGIGFYEGALTAAFGIYAILSLLQRWERRSHKKIRVIEVYIELSNAVSIRKITQELRDRDMKLENIQFEPDGAVNSDTRAVILTIKTVKRQDHALVLEQIQSLNGVVYIEEL